MSRAPITKQQSPWEPVPAIELRAELAVLGAWFTRRVHDGTLRACVAEEPTGWHLSVSFVNHRRVASRYPSWDELADARDQLLPADVGFVMHLPRTSEYVAVHPTTFHLHEHPERSR